MSALATSLRFSAFVLVLFSLSTAIQAQTQTPAYRPSVVEAMLTPKFCWKQFLGPKFSGPRYSIPRSTCGVFVNHYCPGLVQLNRANRVIGNEGKRRDDLLSAKEDTLYTLRGIKRYPNCPIRAHAEMTLRVINGELQAFR